MASTAASPSPSPPSKSDPVVIVGAGIFGLSTALHLAQRGYADVTVLDRQPYDRTRYSYLAGCDAASADLNKIVRCAYGDQAIYQALALESLAGWKAWNDELTGGGEEEGDARLFLNNGHLSITEGEGVPDFESRSIVSMEAAGYRDALLVVSDDAGAGVARAKGFGYAVDPFGRKAQGKTYVGVLDTTGGEVRAAKACYFALQKARARGVKLVLDPVAGALDSVVCGGGGGLGIGEETTTSAGAAAGRRVRGIRTQDGKVYPAAVAILACGGWTPALLPAMDGLCETTAGSVVMMRIPRDSALWDRLSPANFPSWSWNMRGGAEGGLYGFPRDEDGWFKVGYRGTKYTNPIEQADGRERSVPVTKWSHPQGEGDEDAGEGKQPTPATSIPEQALKVITRFLDEHLPELRAEGIGIALTRLCWYTDSFDNHLVIDRVPGTQGLLVATGGSGHAFKYLPAVGKYVVDVMEGVGLDRPNLKAWRWRSLGEAEKPYNVLMEGKKGPQALRNVVLRSEAEL